MKKPWDKAILFAISLALGLILMMQFETKQNVLGNNTPDEKTVELNNELTKLTIIKNELSEEIEKLKEEAKINEAVSMDRESEINRLQEEIDKQKILSGYYDVKGPGVIIKINSEPNSFVNLASSHQYILALISYLNNAGVEAISINGQRYTNYTEIIPVLDHINVNGIAMVLPLEIKAIGYHKTIEASLNFVGGIVSQMSQVGYTIETEYVDEVLINRYDGEKEFKYVVPIPPEEFE